MDIDNLLKGLKKTFVPLDTSFIDFKTLKRMINHVSPVTPFYIFSLIIDNLLKGLKKTFVPLDTSFIDSKTVGRNLEAPTCTRERFTFPVLQLSQKL